MPSKSRRRGRTAFFKRTRLMEIHAAPGVAKCVGQWRSLPLHFAGTAISAAQGFPLQARPAARKSPCLNCGFPAAIHLVVLFGANAARIFVIGWHRPTRARLATAKLHGDAVPA